MTFEGPTTLLGVDASSSTDLGVDLRSCPPPQEDGAFLVRAGKRQSCWLRQGAIHRAWTAPSFIDMTVAPTFEVSGGRFASVVNGKRLLLWDGEETRLDKVEGGLDLDKRAVDLLRQGTGAPGELVVVFEDGSAQALS